jgi:hypothetical protein
MFRADMSSRRVQVFVWDEPHIITVFRRHKAHWIAHGVYMGKSLSVKHETESEAMKQWRLTAESVATELTAAAPLPTD